MDKEIIEIAEQEFDHAESGKAYTLALDHYHYKYYDREDEIYEDETDDG
jgi:hypothetical protein